MSSTPISAYFENVFKLEDKAFSLPSSVSKKNSVVLENTHLADATENSLRLESIKIRIHISWTLKLG